MSTSNVLDLSKSRPRAAGKDTALDDAMDALRPFLREYLAKQGVVFDRTKADAFHCFNKAAHTHSDADASAALNPKANHTRFKCFACGIEGDIFEACRMLEGRSLEGRDFVETVRHLAGMFNVPFPETAPGAVLKIDEPTKRLTAEYLYTTDAGEPRYRVQRFIVEQFGKPVVDDTGKPKKEFRPQKYAGNGQWTTGYGDVQRTLYRLPEVKAAIAAGQDVYFVEGEKCADIMREQLGLTATTIAGGSNAWIKPHTAYYIRELAGARVVILADNDTAGKKFGEMVAADVAGITASVKLVELPGLPPKGDIEQWNQLHPDDAKDALLDLVAGWSEWKREKKVQTTLDPVYIREGRYWRRGDDRHGDTAISNFTIHPLGRVVPDGGKILEVQWQARVEIESKAQYEATITLDAFINRVKFKSAFPHEGLSYTGTEDDLQFIKRLFGAEPHDMKRGVKFLGFHQADDGRALFVSNSKTIDQDGAETNNIVLMDGEQQITTGVLDVTALDADSLASIIKPLFGFNTLDKCITILGWVGHCFLREKLYQAKVKCPHLFIYGEAGSGKSQTVESVLMPLFCTDDKFAAGQLTDFGAARLSASSNTIPFIIDEYKPFAIGEVRVKRISELLRQTYERTTIVRGRQDLSTVSYQYRAPVCLVGEEGTDETANKERGLELLFSKRALGGEGYHANFYALKEHGAELRRLGRSMLATAMSLTDDVPADWYNDSMAAIRPKIKAKMPGMPDRVASSVACCMVGIWLLQATLQGLGTTLEQETGLNIDVIMDAILTAVYENIMDEQGTTKAAVDHILEIMDRMAARGLYQEGVHYQIINDGAEVALNISSMYDDFKKYRREYEVRGESLEMIQFTKQLRNASYFSRYEKVRFRQSSSKNTQRAFILSVPSAVFCLDIPTFTGAE